MKKRVDEYKRFVTTTILVYIIAIILLAVATKSSVAVVFIGMFPSYAHLLFLLAWHRHKGHHHAIVWFMPLALVLFFLAIWKSDIHPILTNMDGILLAVLNLFIANVLSILFIHHRHEEMNEKRLEKKIEHLEHKFEPPKDLHVTLRTIEDKCKAMNFVIGRVYSDKRGGSKDIREQLRINKEWYNVFSAIAQDPTTAESGELKGVLHQIMDRLKVLESKETEIFKPRAGKIALERSATDSILDVLEKNDKDPIRDYHAQAKEIVGQLLSLVKKGKSPL